MKKIIFLVLLLTLILVGCTAEPENEPFAPNPESDKTVAHNFEMTDLDGKPVQLSTLLEKPVVLNFWAPWCPPCKEEMPNFESAFKECGEDVNFIMLSVSMDTSVGEVKAFLEENEYTFPTYFDAHGQGVSRFDVNTIPRTFFITTNGEIVLFHKGILSEDNLKKGIAQLKEAQILVDEEAEKEAETETGKE